jgi:hypothetical protein
MDPITMAVVGSSLLGGLGGILGGGAKKKQAKKTIADYTAAETGSKEAYTGARDASLGYYQPYAAGGQQGFQNALAMQTPGYDYQSNDPGYQYLVDQMQNSTTRGAAAGGGVNSGGFFKALQRNAAGLAAQDFQNSFNRNNTLANYGMQAAEGMTGVQSGYAGGISNALFNAAQGRAGARVDRGNAIASQFGSAFGGLQGALGGMGGGGGGGSVVEAKGGGVGSFFGF